MDLFLFPVFDSKEKLLQINKFPSNIYFIGIHSQHRAISLPWAHETGGFKIWVQHLSISNTFWHVCVSVCH